MSQRKLGTILSYLHILITNSISLVYTPFMLRMMGQSEYGLYGTANSFISYLSILSFGIGGAYIRFNARCRANNNREDEKRLNGMFLVVFSFLAVLVFIGGVIFIALAGKLVENTFSKQELLKLRIIMLILTVNMMITFISNVVMMALQAYEKFICIRMVLLFAGIITPVVNIIALLNDGKAVAISTISLVISILTYLFFWIYALKEIRLEFTFKGFMTVELKEIFVFSGFLFLNSITDQITFSTDNMVLSAVRGTTVVAVYSVGANFKAYFQNFSSSISSVFAPQINKIVAHQSDMKELNDIFIRIGRIQFYVVSLIMIGYLSIGQDFIKLWAGENYSEAFYVGLLLMLAVFVPAFQNVGLEIQKAKNMHKARSIVYFLIALINVIMTIPLSNKYGAIGAALATAICMFLGTVIFMNFYYAKYIKLDILGFWKSIFAILPGYITPIFVGGCINKFWNLNSYFEILLAVALICFSFTISIWFFSMNQYEKNLFRKPIKKLLN